MPTAERLTDRVVHHGEGPCWSPTWGGLRFVDLLEGDVMTLAADGSVSRSHWGERAAITRPRTRGGSVVAVERGLVLEDADGTRHVQPELWGPEEGVRMNEGGCDPDGRFYAGTMAYGATPGRGSLHRVDADGTVTTVLTGVTVSNGFDFSPDRTLAYYNDTGTGRTDVFDWTSEGGLANRRLFARVNDETGLNRPDGLTVDAEGGVWTGLFGGSAVRRYAPDGTLDEVVEVGARQVTAVAFGGDDLSTLFITTSRENLAEGDDPAAGSLFRYEPGVRGMPVLPYAG